MAQVTYVPTGAYAGRVSTREDGLGNTWSFAYSTATITPPSSAATSVKRTTVTNPMTRGWRRCQFQQIDLRL